MPHVYNQGVRIHYQVKGEGRPLVLQHGFTDSLESWYEMGYVDALKNDYKLIAVDARGHGASDKPHEPTAYTHERHVADLVAVLDALTLPTAHFFGYSMGGRIGFALAKYAPTRFSSFIIGGATPYQVNRERWLQMIKRGPESLVAAWDGAVSPALRARLLANDIEAMAASWVGRMENSDLEDVLPTMRKPCLVLVGEADGAYPRVKECATHMPNVMFVSFPGLKHSETFFHSDLVLPHVMRFLATVAH